MFLGSVAVLCTILVINTHNTREDTHMPHLLKWVTCSVLVRVACYKSKCCCLPENSKVSPERNRTYHSMHGNDIMTITNIDEPEVKKRQSRTKWTSIKRIITNEKEWESLQTKINCGIHNDVSSKMSVSPRDVIVRETISDKSNEEETLTWKELSLILDKFFFVVFLFAVFSSSVILFVLIWNG